VLAAILSTISFYWYFVEPVRTISINRSEIPNFIIFTAFAALLSRFGTFRQRAEADLRRTHDQLKIERPKLGSRTIALLYFAFSSCWILFTDRLVNSLGLSNTQLLKVSEAKGILFISLSTLLMYVLVEKALRQRHSVATAYWQLVETAQEGVWSVDTEGKTVFANENMAAILGTSQGEMIGKSILPFVPPEKKDELLNRLLRRERGLQEHYEFAFLRADGAQVWTLLRVSPVFRHGQYTGSLALVSDITERKRAEEALRRLNRELRAISNCNQTLLRATDEQSLLEEICRIVCEEAGYRMAWAGYAEPDEAKSVRPVAWSGAEEGFLANLGITWADTERGCGPTGMAIRSGKTCYIQDFATDPRLAPWRESLLQRGFRSGIALPLKDEDGSTFGSLTIHSAQPNAFTSEEVRLLEELAGDLAFGIVTLRSRAARKQAQEALRQSEFYLAEAQRVSHTGSWYLDVVHNRLSWSEEAFRIFGIQRGTPLTYETFLAAVHTDDRALVDQAWKKALLGAAYDVEHRILVGREVRWVRERAQLEFDADGRATKGIGTVQDITERKRAEEALALHSFALNNAHEAIFLIDEQARFLYVNEECCRSLGYTREELLGMGVPDIDLDFTEERWPDHWHALRAQRSLNFESHHRTKDGRFFPVEISAKYLGYGGRAFNLAVVRDITERKRAEQTLHERADLLNLTHDTVFVMDMEGVIKYWNRGAEERYGWSAEQAVGKIVHDILNTVFPSPLEEIKAEVTRTGRWEGELLHTKKDGTQLVAASRWALQRDEQGAPLAILETNNDITERKRAEEALCRLNRELRAISNCNQTLLHATDEQSLPEKICRIVCEEAGYRMAFVAYAEHDDAKSVRPVAWSGAEEGYLATVGITWADTERGRGPTGTAIRSGKSCCVQDFATDPRLAPWREGLLQRDFRSGIALPLKDEHGNAFGSLTIHSAQPNAFTPEEIRLLEELADDLAFGIVTLRSGAARKRAEQALQQSEAYLAEAQRLSHTGSWALDVASDKWFYWSEEMFRIFGFDPQEGIPARKALFGRILPEDRTRVEGNFQKSLREKVDTSDEYRMTLPDGAVRDVLIIRHPVLNDAGDVVQLFGTAVDITERKRVEERLRQSEAYLAEAQRLSHTGSWALNVASGNYVYASEEYFRISGFDPQQGLPTKDQPLQRIHPDDLDKFWQAFQKVIDEKVDSEGEYRIVLPDGTVKYVHAIRHPVLNANGELVEIVGTTVDITELKRAQEAQRRTATYLADAHRLTHTGAWATDTTMQPLYWSEEVFRFFGFDPQQALPTAEELLQRVHPEDLDKVKQAFDRAICTKVDEEIEFRTVLPDGTVKHVHVLGRPVLNHSGNVVEVVGTVVDITERKRAEEALRRSEAYLSEAQRLTHTGAWATDAVPEPLYWSEELFRLYGLDPQQGFPTHDQVVQRVHPEDRDKYVQAFHRLIHQKVDSDVEFRTVLPDGAIRYLYGLGHPVLNANGELVEIVGTTVDITERKRAEEELRESETRFRTFVDHAGDALFVQDLEQGTIVDVNREACESLGYTRQELIGKTPLAFHLESDQAEMEAGTERAVEGETVFDRHWHRRKDGSLFPVEVRTSLVSYGGRRFLLQVARDISDRVQAEEQRERLRQLEADLAHINRVSMMGELAASIAHEVNQPLSGVVSNASACLRWLAGDVPNMEEAREATRRIVRDGKRAGEVIARIRALTKKAATPRERLHLNETIREVLALVGDQAKRNSVMIRTRFADDLSLVSGDQVQLQQVVLNLVMNGMEAMSSVGERARELVITTRNLAPDQVQVTVEDSGIGLDPNTIAKIFDPFYTTKRGGMGMGLSICRSILQAHGGRLWATAKDGPGTAFHFTLPKCHKEESNAGAARV